MKKKMKNSRKTAVLAASVLAATMFLGGGAVYASAKYQVTNNLQTGRVDIDLEEYEMDGGKKVISDRQYEDILPGETVSKIPEITNLGAESYIRAKLKFTGTDIPLYDEISGMDSKWVKAGDGYYYYTEPVKTGETVELFEGIQIPADYPQSEEGKTFQLTIDAEAIQSKNFTPDFDAESPWGDAVILEAEADSTGTTDRESADPGLTLVYQGDSKGFFSSADDFFSGLPTLYPGDSYSDIVHLTNSTANSVKLYFAHQAEEDTGLLEKLDLEITLKQGNTLKLIYSGPMKTDEMEKAFELVDLGAGETADLKFTVSMPAELNNKYASRLEHVVWYFSAEEEPVTEPSVPSGSGNTPGTTTTTGKVLTGDTADVGKWLMISGGALLALLGAGYGLLRKEEQTDLSAE